MKRVFIIFAMGGLLSGETMAMGSKNDKAARSTTEYDTAMGRKKTEGEKSHPATESDDTDLKTSSEAIVEDSNKKPTTPNATSEGVAERKGQADPSGPHSYIGTRARGKALQTDKFPPPA
ncbi:MAG: hypothetical protein NDI63_09255 [Pseudobdellovibrio sp.]|nr:hypothetical protein [Pseudobdellovibrio sp.]